MTPQTGQEVIETLRRDGDAVLLAFSRGKDSIGTWLAIRDAGLKVIPFHMYLIPHLSFVDDSLKYYEDFFGTRIYNLPHPSLYRWLNHLVLQAPENIRTIEAARLPDFDYDELHAIIKRWLGLDPLMWVVSGVRAADSPNRRAAINSYGAMNYKRRMAYPIWDWNKARLMDAIRVAGVKLPIDYRWFGRSFDGIDRRFLQPLGKYSPADYQKILEYFPLAEADIWRARYGTQAQAD